MQETLPDLPLFIADSSKENDFKESDAHIFLDSVETRHLTKVLRKDVGYTFLLGNGEGIIALAKLTEIHKQFSKAKILQVLKDEPKPLHSLSVGISLLQSNERFEFFLEKATEIGIQQIFPIICERTQRKKYNAERYQKIILSATKQSLKTRIPILKDVQKFTHLTGNKEEEKLIAHCEWEESRKFIAELGKPKNSTLILIGPEGDFSPAEIAHAKKNGFVPLSLGNERLRSETAGLAACLFHQTRLRAK